MGKSPAKWIKTLLLGKKSSKSNLSKGREKLNSANKGEVLVSSKVTVSDLAVDPPSISAPILVTSARNVVGSETDIPTKLPNDGGNIPSVKEDGSDNAISNLSNLEDPERIRLDQAAAKAQAAFRGYLARRAFRTLKGIIRLQAFIRGHLVRRQAVATLCCTWGIVKFQAVARGQKGSKSSDSFRVSTSALVKNLSNNAFVQKLLASSPAALPLRLQYGPEEPNSSWQWLQLWTRSRFWEAPSQPIKSLASKSQTKGDANGQGKTKRSVRKLSNAKVENGSSRSNLEYEKPKRGLRRVFGNTADSAREHSQNELEKVKRNLRKLSDSAKEVFDKSEVVNDKTKQTLKKTSSSDAPDVSEQESTEKMIDVTATLSETLNLEADLKLPTLDASPDESNICPAVDLQPAENNGVIENMQVTEELSPKDEQVSDESSKANQRRASFPAKIDNQENGLNSMPKVPSYMAPTESAKARLRGQGSPRFTRDVVEKNGLNRRYSLPSSTANNLSSLSPRAQRLVQVAGKGAIRNEKSLSSSRDANDKVVRAEWRR
ncbi:protein IQ-DOMAIN 31-like isoform X2 [Herrania umbratica]|uniref:Protein IQ-DOMAIN 31-like isoform X2 n=1 Tax=Herrania umbratica TaxID=108875 RepID=A0A6J1BL02_9ROSI|nr:protein IQ-DOMAIN 31-like isoform X2 [Herrania umbratica]